MSVLLSFFGAPSRVRIPDEFEGKNELLKYLGVSLSELKKIWWFREKMYRNFDISKKSGKSRTINAPNYRLKMLQRKIKLSLNKIYRPRNPVHGFVPDRSVKTNAMSHLRRRYIVNIDLKDYFPSISEPRVKGLLDSLGIDEEVASIVARVCCRNGCLPQGAPSSPVFSNMICFRLDKSLMNFAKAHRLLYTRYADDITLSSFQPPTVLFDGIRPPAGKLEPSKITEKLRNIIIDNGFEIHPDKIHYADKKSRRLVTGLKINEGLNVNRKYIRNIRAALFKIENVSVAAAQSELESRFGRFCSIQAHLQGKISWVGFAKGQSDPVFRSLATRYNASFPDNSIKVHPTKDEILDRSVWVLETEANTGTVFFLKDVGLVTAAHCVKGAENIIVFHPSKPSNQFVVGVSKICAHRDLALLSHSIPATDHFELEQFTDTAAIGDDTVAAGFPSFGPGDRLNIRPGAISSLTKKHAINLIEVTQKLGQGMSGGPLMTVDHSVLGIIHKGGPAEPRDFAVNITELAGWVLELS